VGPSEKSSLPVQVAGAADFHFDRLTFEFEFTGDDAGPKIERLLDEERNLDDVLERCAL